MAWFEPDIDIGAAVPLGYQSYVEDGQLIPWGLLAIGATDHSRRDAKDVEIYVVDTGVSHHKDVKVKGTYDFLTGSTHDGHGTHIAGTIAAKDNREGIVGVTTKSDLYNLKVLDLGEGQNSRRPWRRSNM